MNIAIFGGTFDPIHRGHLAVARAAADRFRLKQVYFVPAYIPPHKRNQSIASFGHRYTMTALATSGDPRFVPSMLESSDTIQRSGAQASYSVDTVRRLRSQIGPKDKLFFIIGIDAFLDIAKWYRPVELLRECEFIIANRPGYSLADAARALPEPLRLPEDAMRAAKKLGASASLILPGASLHLLGEVHDIASSTRAREAAKRGKGSLAKLVGEAVADYIRKMHLYSAHVSSKDARGTEEDHPRSRLHLVPGPEKRETQQKRTEPE